MSVGSFELLEVEILWEICYFGKKQTKKPSKNTQIGQTQGKKPLKTKPNNNTPNLKIAF